LRRHPAQCPRRAGAEAVRRGEPPVHSRLGHRPGLPPARRSVRPGRRTLRRRRRLLRLPERGLSQRPLCRGVEGRQHPALRRGPVRRGDQPRHPDRPHGASARPDAGRGRQLRL
ncbi:hypothetical protein LTR94_033435, partial [Friedmanniomyces endolithicus]